MEKMQKNKRNNRRKKKLKREEHEFDRKVISIRRVAKVRAGAKRLRFSATVVVGDRKGKVAVALGRGGDVRSAIEKAAKYGSAHLVQIDLIGDTVPHEVTAKYAAAKVMLKPAGPGTGVIASGTIRSVMELAGVRNVLTKQLGSSSPVSNAYCAFEALKQLSKKRILERRSEMLKKKISDKKKLKPKKKDAAS